MGRDTEALTREVTISEPGTDACVDADESRIQTNGGSAPANEITVVFVATASSASELDTSDPPPTAEEFTPNHSTGAWSGDIEVPNTTEEEDCTGVEEGKNYIRAWGEFGAGDLVPSEIRRFYAREVGGGE